MKLLFRNNRIVDVFLDDDITPKHGWGRHSAFFLYPKDGKTHARLIGGNPLSDVDYNILLEKLNAVSA